MAKVPAIGAVGKKVVKASSKESPAKDEKKKRRLNKGKNL